MRKFRKITLVTILCGLIILSGCSDKKNTEPSSSSSLSSSSSSSSSSSEMSSSSEISSSSEVSSSSIASSSSQAPIDEKKVEVTISSQNISLGEAIMLTVENAGEQEVSAKSTLGRNIKFYTQDDKKLALVPVSYYTQVGDYKIDVTVGEEVFSYPVKVNDYPFVVQNLTVDESTASSTINSNEANKEWNEKIEPLKYITDPEQYWTEEFLQPVLAGRISTPFGVIRYTNGSKKAARHGAIDIVADTGVPVPAANRGRVIFAQYTLMSGNVVVIEHGMGLKTWYFHMDEINTTENTIVEKGDIIGKVGATGFVTGPHLHYGMSVNEVYINPDVVIKSE